MAIAGRALENASEHALPLPSAAVDLLVALPRFAGSDFVFSGTAGRRPLSGFSRHKLALDARIAERTVEFRSRHSLARPAPDCGQRHGGAGHRAHVVEGVLNHRGGVIAAWRSLTGTTSAPKAHCAATWATIGIGLSAVITSAVVRLHMKKCSLSDSDQEWEPFRYSPQSGRRLGVRRNCRTPPPRAQ
jgi:hypothetical protein